MFLLKISTIVAILCLVSCTERENKTQQSNLVKNEQDSMRSPAKDLEKLKINPTVALEFIHDYMKQSDRMDEPTQIVEWIVQNSQVTDRFKRAYQQIIEKAYAEEPELGLGFDPILDGQDFPDHFEVDDIDEKDNYITLKGKDWPTFKLVVKLIPIKNQWLVDGCGIVNVPENKRAKQ